MLNFRDGKGACDARRDVLVKRVRREARPRSTSRWRRCSSERVEVVELEGKRGAGTSED